MKEPIDYNDLAVSYLSHYASGNDYSAWDAVDDIVRDSSEEGFEILLELLRQSSSKDEIGFVGAGPLEDWINKHCLQMLDRFESELKKNRKLRFSLGYVSIYDDSPKQLKTKYKAWRNLYDVSDLSLDDCSLK